MKCPSETRENYKRSKSKASGTNITNHRSRVGLSINRIQYKDLSNIYIKDVNSRKFNVSDYHILVTSWIGECLQAPSPRSRSWPRSQCLSSSWPWERGLPTRKLKRWRHNIHVINLLEFSANSNPKWPSSVDRALDYILLSALFTGWALWMESSSVWRRF